MKKYTLFLYVILIVFVSQKSFSQVGINSTGAQPDSTAMIDVSSTSKGALMPRMSQTQRDSIHNPAVGLLIFNTTTSCFNMWSGQSWRQSCFDCDFTPPTLGSNSPVCSGDTVSFTSTALPGATYSWTGPNGFTSTQQNPFIANATTAASGTYYFTATLNGCTSAKLSIGMVVNQTPATPGITSNSPLCVGGTINLTASSNVGAGYSWTGPNGFTSTTQNPVITNATTNASGTYQVVASLNGCNSNDTTVSVSVNNIPSAPAAGSNSPLCAGNTLTLTADTIAGASYSWTGPNSFTASVRNPSVTNVTTANAGTYNVSASVGGCSSAPSSTVVSIATVSHSLQIFSSTGAEQFFVVPACITSVSVDAYGAQGYGSTNASSQISAGGLGGEVSATLTVNPGDSLFVYVGSAGTSQTGGGYNGGANGGFYTSQYIGGHGGGASDVRQNGHALTNRIIVAGGGGGAGSGGCAPYSGGAGGGTTGGDGITCDVSVPGYGGTQLAGGAGNGGGSNGATGTGGIAATSTSGGGGGGGYFGGGGSGWAGGGGGSSYVTPTGSSNIQHTQGNKSGDGKVTISW